MGGAYTCMRGAYDFTSWQLRHVIVTSEALFKYKSKPLIHFCFDVASEKGVDI